MCTRAPVSILAHTFCLEPLLCGWHPVRPPAPPHVPLAQGGEGSGMGGAGSTFRLFFPGTPAPAPHPNICPLHTASRTASVFVCLSYCNKMPELGNLQRTEMHCSQFWRLRAQDQGAGRLGGLVRVCSLSRRRLERRIFQRGRSLCPCVAGGGRGESFQPSFCVKAPDPIHELTALMARSPPTAHTPAPLPWVVSFHMSFGGDRYSNPGLCVPEAMVGVHGLM